jgi:hypothetical protein
MRRLISQLRKLEPTDAGFDESFYQLMNNVMHHVADEETLLLPAAERLLPDQLSQLGAQMTRRRLELAGPRAPELASSMARSMSVGTVIAAGSAALAGAYLLTRHHYTDRLAAARRRFSRT